VNVIKPNTPAGPDVLATDTLPGPRIASRSFSIVADNALKGMGTVSGSAAAAAVEIVKVPPEAKTSND